MYDTEPATGQVKKPKAVDVSPDFDLDCHDRAMRYFRSQMIPADISISYILILRLLARRHCLNQKEIAMSLGFGQASVSKLLRAMGGYVKKDGRNAGLGLVEVERDRIYRNQTNVTLSDRGEDLITHYNRILKGEGE